MRRETDSTTARLGAHRGPRVTGRVGDPSFALGAIEDELRVAGADEGFAPAQQANWLETGIVERLREDIDSQITHTGRGC